MKTVVLSLILALLPLSVFAQTSQPSTSGLAWSPAKNIGMFAYPKNEQNADQHQDPESIGRRQDLLKHA